MKKIIYLSFLLLFIGNIFSQESKLKLSKLGDPKYFENYVKYIPDEILFESMNLDYKGLEKIKKYVEEKNFQKAYEEWGKYWNSKEKLDVIADLNDHFISKSDFLERYNENKRKEILIEAEKLLNNEIMGWGKTVFKFGDVIDFNANYGDSGKYG
ncbi:MAG TPA: heparinase II/III family protein, partial [Bacteroidota bacterium]|nr:heparinase II/III family protein [Bacteroidota bacterium]